MHEDNLWRKKKKKLIEMQLGVWNNFHVYPYDTYKKIVFISGTSIILNHQNTSSIILEPPKYFFKIYILNFLPAPP